LIMSEPSSPTREIDALFKRPLGEFTAARNTLVAELKKAGKHAEANEAKALVKPSVSAWVVNQLYWRHREAFDRLIEAGDRLRRAQTSQRKNDAGREPIIARREAVTALGEIAAEILREADHGATRDLLRRVMSTLEAFSSYGSQPGAPVPGRLTDDLEPPGFEAVGGFLSERDNRAPTPTRLNARSPVAKLATKTARAAGQPERRDEQEHKALLAAAKAGLREAERALNAARKEAERAAARLDAAAARAKAIEKQRALIEKQLVEAAKNAAAAQHDATEAATIAKDATQAAEAAERALELARARVQQVARSHD
jgi:hypothetical protein